MKKTLSILLAVLLLLSAFAPAAIALDGGDGVYPAAQVMHCKAQTATPTYYTQNEHVFYLDGSVPSGKNINSTYVPKGYAQSDTPVKNAYTFTATAKQGESTVFTIAPEDSIVGCYTFQSGAYTDLSESPVTLSFASTFHSGVTLMVNRLWIAEAVLDGADVTAQYAVTQDTISKIVQIGHDVSTAKISGPAPEADSVLDIVVGAETWAATAAPHGEVTTTEYLRIHIETPPTTGTEDAYPAAQMSDCRTKSMWATHETKNIHTLYALGSFPFAEGNAQYVPTGFPEPTGAFCNAYKYAPKRGTSSLVLDYPEDGVMTACYTLTDGEYGDLSQTEAALILSLEDMDHDSTHFLDVNAFTLEQALLDGEDVTAQYALIQDEISSVTDSNDGVYRAKLSGRVPTDGSVLTLSVSLETNGKTKGVVEQSVVVKETMRLQFASVDKRRLTALIQAEKAANRKQSSFTDAAWEAYTAAFAEAKAVLARDSAVQSEIDKAFRDLLTARNPGSVEDETVWEVLREDLYVLVQAEKAIGRTEAEFTNGAYGTWAAYTAALQSAEAVCNDLSASQSAIYEAYQTLKDLIPDPGSMGEFGTSVWGRFNEISGTLTLYGSGTVDYAGTYGMAPADSVKSIVLAEGIQGVNRLHLQGTAATTLSLPATVNDIQPGAFSTLTALKAFRVSNENTLYAQTDGILTDKQGETLVAFPAGYNETEIYPVPRQIRSVAGGAFAGTQNVRSLIVSNAVGFIGRDAFAEMPMLENIECVAGSAAQTYCTENDIPMQMMPERTSTVTFNTGVSVGVFNKVPSRVYHFTYYGWVEDGQVRTAYETPVFGELPVATNKDSSIIDSSRFLFCNWRIGSESGPVAEPTTQIPHDVTLYIGYVYDEPSRTMALQATGATPVQTTATYKEGEVFVVPDGIPERKHTVTFDPGEGTLTTGRCVYSATFAGWNTRYDGTGNTYFPGESFVVNGVSSLYAQWLFDDFSPMPVPKRTGYTFLGWYTQDGKLVTKKDSVSEDITLYAQWSASENVFVFYQANFEGDNAWQEKQPQESVQIRDALPDKTWTIRFFAGDEKQPSATQTCVGKFAGWQTADGTVYAPGDVYDGEENLTLYPIWTSAEIGAFPPVKKSGYALEGWYTYRDFETQVSETTAVYGDMALYACWTQRAAYTVTYHANGGDYAPAAQTKYNGEVLTLTDKTPSFSAVITYNTCGGTMTASDLQIYEADFIGWNTNSLGTGEAYLSGGKYIENADLVLFAKWDYPQIELPLPENEGHSFLGWFTERDGGTQVTGQTLVTESRTLYAHWTNAQTYTVTYSANGGTNAPEMQTVQMGKSVTLRRETPKRSHTVTFEACGGSLTTKSLSFDARFIGWNVRMNGTGTYYQPEDTITPDDNLKLYAQWGFAQIVLPEPVLTGYTFDGWFTARTGGTKVAATEPVNADRTIYAHWTLIPTYAVTYHGNGGSGVADVQIKTENEPLTLTQTVPTRLHSIRFDPCGGTLSVKQMDYNVAFTGWNTEPSGKGTPYHAGQTYTDNAPLTLYAQWEIPTVNALPVPTYIGRCFDGWFTQKSGGTKYSDQTQVTEDVVLYAHWRDLSYSFNNWSPTISAATYRAAFGSSTLTDRLSAVVAAMVYPNSGICYGMATTAMLMIPGGKVQTDAFGEAAIWDFAFRKLGEYSNGTLTLENFIKQMQVSQYSAAAQNSLKRDVDALLRTVEDGNIARVSITKNRQGHALVAYKTVKESENRLRLFVYDCNHSGDYSRYILLQRLDGAWRWSYDMGNGLGTWSSETGDIGYQSYADIEALWDNMGRLLYATADRQDHLMIVRSERFALYDKDGKRIAVYDGGFRENALGLREIAVESTGMSEEAETWHLFYLPADTVTVRNLSDGAFHAELIDINYGAVADTSADTIHFTVRDACTAAGESTPDKVCRAKISDTGDKAYTYEIQMFPGAKPTSISGESDKPLEFSLENGKLLTGVVERFSVRSSTYTLRYGEYTTLYAETDELPMGTHVEWTADSNAVRLEPAEDGLSCKVYSVQNGNAQVTASVVDSDGTVRKRTDGQAATGTLSIRSKVNIFWMFVSFFKNLFHMVREQSLG